jgi:hypothetical protein
LVTFHHRHAQPPLWGQIAWGGRMDEESGSRGFFFSDLLHRTHASSQRRRQPWRWMGRSANGPDRADFSSSFLTERMNLPLDAEGTATRIGYPSEVNAIMEEDPVPYHSCKYFRGTFNAHHRPFSIRWRVVVWSKNELDVKTARSDPFVDHPAHRHGCRRWLPV